MSEGWRFRVDTQDDNGIEGLGEKCSKGSQYGLLSFKMVLLQYRPSSNNSAMWIQLTTVTSMEIQARLHMRIQCAQAVSMLLAKLSLYTKTILVFSNRAVAACLEAVQLNGEWNTGMSFWCYKN